MKTYSVECYWTSDEIRFSMLVWHFARWDGLMKFVEKKFNCKTNWLSDEDVDLMDLLKREREEE